MVYIRMAHFVSWHSDNPDFDGRHCGTDRQILKEIYASLLKGSDKLDIRMPLKNIDVNMHKNT